MIGLQKGRQTRIANIVSTAMLSALTKTFFNINNEPILIRSTQAAGIVQDMFAGEGEGGEEETTSRGYFYRYFYCSG